MRYVQLLTPEGALTEDPGHAFTPTPELARGLYRDMVLVRRMDTEAMALQRQGELALWPPLLGQEAAQIGAARALDDKDYVFPSYREHGLAWARGIAPADLLSMWRGTVHGGWDPTATGVALNTIVIGAQALHAVGYAMGMQRDGVEDGAVLCCFGDGATSQGDLNESFIWAATNNAPIVFYCQNNQWAISAPSRIQTRIPLHQRAAGFGFPSVQVDGNDVFACLAVTRAALERAREGGGPTFVEAYTYRMSAHTSSDDPKRYRPDAELEEWKARDPIDRLRAYLTSTGTDDAFFASVDADAEELGRDLRRDCRALPDPDPAAIFEEIYATRHPLVEEERDQFLTYLDSFA